MLAGASHGGEGPTPTTGGVEGLRTQYIRIATRGSTDTGDQGGQGLESGTALGSRCAEITEGGC